MPTCNDFDDRFNEYLSVIESSVENFLPDCKSEYDVLREAMAYAVTGGGKRIRPVLCLEFCRILCGDYKRALNFAIAVEYIHSYSLIHDDLPCMDNDDYRRGKLSTHKKFGEANGLLAGDALLTHAFSCLASGDNTPVQIAAACKYLADNSGANGMVGGQVVDLMSEGSEINADTLFLMDKLKTAALIKCACVLGCIAADSQESIPNAEKYALNLGLAFQIVDDILDFLEGEDNSDIKKNKATYVSIFGLDGARSIADKYTTGALEAADTFGEEGLFLKTLAQKLLKRNV